MSAPASALQQPAIPPIDPAEAGEVAFTLAAVRKKTGRLPNMITTLAHSPAALNAYLAYSSALATGRFAPALREQIALAVAGSNGCDYCASAHTALAKQAGVSAEEARGNLRGQATQARTQLLLDLAKDIVENQGRVSPDRLAELRGKGITDADVMELIAIVGLNIFTNYVNHVAATEIDFPLVRAAGA